MSTPDSPPEQNDGSANLAERIATAETRHAAAELESAGAIDAYVGREIDDRYRIVRALGEGGMGAVFIAEHLKLGSEVALKVIRPELMKSEEIAARFAREAMASARLNHPHVASALDYGTLPEGGAYLVMQLARGVSLSSFLDARGAIPWQLATEIAAQIADAAAAAHAVGIVHRDLKPDNVFVEEREDGAVLCQVLDFGIARVQVEGGSTNDAAAPGRALTTVGTIMGTPGYMAPEQAMGQAADPRADLYSLGVMLSEMISGEPLFDGDSLTAIVTSQLTQGPPRVAEQAVARALPPALEALLRSLVAPEARMRPDRASEVRDTLRRIARADETGTINVRRTGEIPVARRSTPTGGVAASLATRSVPSLAAMMPRAESLRSKLPAPLARLPLAVLASSLAFALVVVFASLSAFGSEPARPEAGTDEGAAPATPSVGALVPSGIRPIVEAARSITRSNEVDERYEVLLSSEDREARRAAAEELVAYQPAQDVPAVARAVAELEIGRNCRDRQVAVLRLGELRDSGALPALERLAATPRRGCGFLSSKDCHRCLRSDLDAVIEQLGGSTAP